MFWPKLPFPLWLPLSLPPYGHAPMWWIKVSPSSDWNLSKFKSRHLLRGRTQCRKVVLKLNDWLSWFPTKFQDGVHYSLMDYQKKIQETQKKHNVKWPKIWLLCLVLGMNVESFNFLRFLHFRWYWKVSVRNRWHHFIMCWSAANKYDFSAGHYEQKSQKTTRQMKFSAITIKQRIKLCLMTFSM